MKLLNSLTLIAVSAVLSKCHHVEGDATILEDPELYDTLMKFPVVEDRALRGRKLDEADNAATDLLEFHYFGSVPQIVKDALANVSKQLNSLIVTRTYYKLEEELVIKDTCNLPISEDVVFKPQILRSILVYVGPGSRDDDPDIQAYAYPCRDYYDRVYQRSLVGVIRFHPDVVNDTETNAQFIHDLFLHETIHVLGFGVFWTRKIFYGMANSPKYLGLASVEYRKLLPEDDHRKERGLIPLEDVGGITQAEVHWRSSVFPDEIMSGTVFRDIKKKFSIMTAAALEDLGFTVNYSSPLIELYDIPYYEDTEITQAEARRRKRQKKNFRFYPKTNL